MKVILKNGNTIEFSDVSASIGELEKYITRSDDNWLVVNNTLIKVSEIAVIELRNN